jgi:type I site-specific restriction endonuclease
MVREESDWVSCISVIGSIQHRRQHWQDIRLSMLEQLRRKMRELIKFIARRPSNPAHSVLSDEIGEATVVNLKDFNTGINLEQYKKKVESAASPPISGKFCECFR